MAALSERIRRAAVAGYFYPGDAASLRAALGSLVPAQRMSQAARAMLVPHGSFAQCGRILGAAWAAVTVPRRVVVLGPSHVPAISRWTLSAPGAWRTPLGEVPVDAEAVGFLQSRCPLLQVDEGSHQGEHAIEVQLPFLQVLGPAHLVVTPIVAADERATTCAAVAEALADLVRASGEPLLLVASSDLSAFEPRARRRMIDQALTDAVCRLDSVRLRQVVEASETVMCGLGAVSCLLDAARALGATQGRLIACAASDDEGGDPESSTGYAGVVVT